MTKISLLTLLAAAAMAQSQNTGRQIGNGLGVLESGVTLSYRSVLEPPQKNSAFLPLGSGYQVSGNIMRHFIYDKAAQSYFGYDMAVTPAPDGKGFQVSFGPLTVSGMTDALKAVAGDLPLNPAPLPKYPAPQIVFSGDTIALDLMISPDGREKIVDYIQVTAPSKSSRLAAADPRDFSIDDGPLAFFAGSPSVFVNGEKSSRSVAMTMHGGATLWFYFPGQGRYILSLAPHEGFAKSGTVRSDVIDFQADGQQYEIQLGAPIAGSGKAWNLYVLHDSAYFPADAALDSPAGGVDRLENLLPKRL